jgi:hypothetical protein
VVLLGWWVGDHLPLAMRVLHQFMVVRWVLHRLWRSCLPKAWCASTHMAVQDLVQAALLLLICLSRGVVF